MCFMEHILKQTLIGDIEVYSPFISIRTYSLEDTVQSSQRTNQSSLKETFFRISASIFDGSPSLVGGINVVSAEFCHGRCAGGARLVTTGSLCLSTISSSRKRRAVSSAFDPFGASVCTVDRVPGSSTELVGYIVHCTPLAWQFVHGD